MNQAAATDPTADFAQFFLEDESHVEIELPNDEPMLYQGQPVVVVVHGPSTKEWAAAQSVKEKAATARVFQGLGVKKKGQDKNTPDPEDIDAQFLTAITKRIDNFPFPGGPAAVYADRRLQYIARQVNQHVANLGNFFKPSTKS